MPPTKNAQSLEEIKDILRNYMKSQYRPYSTNDILLNLHNQIPKQKLGLGLASLVEDNELLVKVVGKTSYYCYKMLVPKSNKAETALLDDIPKMEKMIAEIEVEMNGIISETKDIKSEPSNDAITQNLADTKEKIKALKDEQAKPNPNTLDSHELKLRLTQLRRVHKQYKGIFNSLRGTLLDITENKNILSSIGIEEAEIKRFQP